VPTTVMLKSQLAEVYVAEKLVDWYASVAALGVELAAGVVAAAGAVCAAAAGACVATVGVG